jgi:tetraacyldisaccharide 4'-kinase
MLREPLGALKRADMMVITRSDQVEPRIMDMLKGSLRKVNPEAPLLVSRHEVKALRNVHTQKSRDRNFLKGKKVLGFCGIGNPRAFHGLLNHLGAEVASFHAFRDHFRYSSEIVGLMAKEAGLLGCDALVTTQKDGVKLREHKVESEILEVLIEVKITEGLEHLQESIDRLTGAN